MIIWQKMWKELQWSAHNQCLHTKINISQFTRRCSDYLFGPRSLSHIAANCFPTLCFIFPVRISFTLKGTFHSYFSGSILCSYVHRRKWLSKLLWMVSCPTPDSPASLMYLVIWVPSWPPLQCSLSFSICSFILILDHFSDKFWLMYKIGFIFS